jgi:hypothetical protein
MVEDGWVWRSAREGLLVHGAVVSFQRYQCPSERIVREAPSSHGALPVAAEGDHFLLALPFQEAFWVGVIVPKDWRRGTLSFAAMQADGKVLVFERFAQPGTFLVPGIPRADSQFDVFCRESVSELQLAGAVGTKHIVVCDPENFSARSGQAPPEPFNPHAAFGGWLLP